MGSDKCKLASCELVSDLDEGIDSQNFKIESFDNDSKFKLFALKNV